MGLIHRLQDEGRNFDLSRRSAEGGGEQPRMKNPPASVLGEDSIWKVEAKGDENSR